MPNLLDALRPKGGTIPPYGETESKLVLSLTGDILAFRRCPRQYGLHTVRGFAAAHATQEFVGTFAHRCLNRGFRWFKEKGKAPNNEEMARILEEVKDQLKAQRRRPHSWSVVQEVGYRVMRLNRCFETYGIYPRMVDTERTLETDDGDFVIQGKVDVIQGDENRLELWDYKASRDPRQLASTATRAKAATVDRAAAKDRLEDYTLQLRIYSHLYERVHGIRPTGCRLVFLNEIPTPVTEVPWNKFVATSLTTKEWQQAESNMEGGKPGIFFSVPVLATHVDGAMAQFRQTGQLILEARRRDAYPPPKRLPDSGTCDACDLRYGCSTACEKHGYKVSASG